MKLLELSDCLQKMWFIFSSIVEVDRSEKIEEFLDVKDKAHQIISKIAGGEQWNQ